MFPSVSYVIKVKCLRLKVKYARTEIKFCWVHFTHPTYTTEYSMIYKILTSRIGAVFWWISVVDPEEPALSYFETVKVKLALNNPWRLAWGLEFQLHSFLTSVLEEGQWPTSRLGCFILRKVLQYLVFGGLGGYHSRCGWFGETLAGFRGPYHPLRSLVTIPITLFRLPLPSTLG